MTAAIPFQITDDVPQTSLALEASAGTGKTWTLTSLAVRYVAEGHVELPDLLLVTFTRAATAELRERVRRRLAEAITVVQRAIVDPDHPIDDVVLATVVAGAREMDADGTELRARRDRLRRAAQQLDDATISTIHGFCQRMLQHAALEAGVDFDAVLLDDDADLLAEIVDDHLARELRAASPAWVRYLQEVGKVSRSSLTTLARAVSGLPALHLQPDLSGIEVPAWQPWADALSQFRRSWEEGGRDQAIDLIQQMKDDGAFTPGQRTFTGNEARKKAEDVDIWLSRDWPMPPGPVNRKARHRIPDYPMSWFTAAALETKLAEGAAVPHLEVLDASARLLDAALLPATLFRHRAATWIWHELDRRKRQRTVLTYDDLLRRLADALDNPATRGAVRAAIRQRYGVALIDEFQDTDPVQWRIFSALFDEQEPFVLIGDPKQAIYSFRGADVHTYVAARDSRLATRTLQTNHRSDRSYVDACNLLFEVDDPFGTPDIPYHRIDPHHDDRLLDPSGGAALQVRFLARDDGPDGNVTEKGKGLIGKGWADDVQPGDIASVAVDLLDRGITIAEEGAGNRAGGGRPLAPRDIAVLVRTNRRAYAAQRALRDAGVPAVIQRGGSVFMTEEADALQRLLDAMLRPNAERTAVTAAASVLFGWDAPTLVTQRTEAHPDWDRWVDALTRWGELWRRVGILPALRQAFADERVPQRLLTTPEGDRRLTNLRHLAELLHTTAVTDRLTPNALTEWLAAQRADAADGDQPGTETELRLEEDAEAVRVVTIHGSKGLQYPVVLCPDLWDGRVRVNRDLTRFHDPDVGDPLAAITLDLDVNTDSPGKARALDLARQEERTEALRLAYVALTRAQHRCVVWWGAFNDCPTSALACLFHGSDEVDGDAAAGSGDEVAAGSGRRLDRAEARVGSADDTTLIDDLQRLADRSDGAISVEVVDRPGHDTTWTGNPLPAPILDARAFTRGDVDRTWQRASFSSLTRDAEHAHGAGGAVGDGVADPARDVDADADTAGPAGAAAVGVAGAPDSDAAPDGGGQARAGSAQVPLARFPRGAGPGSFLHDVLEMLDLTAMDDDAALDDVLATMERRHGIDSSLRPMVVRGLRAAVATPLGDVAADARLADLGVRDRLNELWFDLPLAGGHAADRSAFSLASVADLLADSGDPLLQEYAERLRDPKLRGDVRGYLVGSIDLLARLPNGRFLVADYKSNWLGDRASGRSVVEHYRPDAMATSLLDSHYVLQALLYLVATHRYLRWRLPDYDYDTHVAGAAYLFLRGMVGPDTPELDGQRYGVATIRPTGDLVEALSRLLDGSGP